MNLAAEQTDTHSECRNHGKAETPGRRAVEKGHQQFQLLPDPPSPFERAHRLARVIRRHGPRRDRTRAFFDALQEGLRG